MMSNDGGIEEVIAELGVEMRCRDVIFDANVQVEQVDSERSVACHMLHDAIGGPCTEVCTKSPKHAKTLLGSWYS